ncbi:MAG: hypothetical protein VB980_00825 [Opitutales bacterium]
MPLLRNWQAHKFLDQSKGYREIGIIDSGRTDEEDAIKTAEKAYLLAPGNMAISRNLAEVYYEVNSVKGLMQWESVVNMPGVTMDDRIHLVKLALKVAAHAHARSREKISAFDENRPYFLDIARRQLQFLSNDDRFSKTAEFRIALAEFSAESGDLSTALNTVMTLRSEIRTQDPKLDLLFCRLAFHAKTPQLLDEAVVILRKLAEGEGQFALHAIRYFVFVHSSVHPLSMDEIKGLHNLLDSKHSKSDERLRVRRVLYSMELSLTSDPAERSRIIERCAKQLDLSIDAELETFCNWLGNEGELEHLLAKLPIRRINRVHSEKLFRIRLAALANLGRFSDLEIELEQSSVLQNYWRHAFSARALSAQRKFTDSKISLNKLVGSIDDDDSKVLSVCKWFEESGDIPSLCHVLETLSNVSPYETFCAEGLLRYRIGSAKLIEIQRWITALSQSKPTDRKLQNHRIYWNLLSPEPSDEQLDEWLKESRLHLKDIPGDLQFRITAALAMLRKNLFVEALTILEDTPGSPNRTNWKIARVTWARIYSIALARNQRTEEYLALHNILAERTNSRAESDALASIFPDLIDQP